MQAGQARSATFPGATVGQRLYNTIEERERNKPCAPNGTKNHTHIPAHVEQSLQAIARFQRRNAQPENTVSLRERSEDLGTKRSVFAEAMVKLKFDASIKSTISSDEAVADRAQRFIDGNGDDLARTRSLDDMIASALEAAEILAEIEKSEGADSTSIRKQMFESYVTALDAEVRFRIDSEIVSLEDQANADGQIVNIIR